MISSSFLQYVRFLSLNALQTKFFKFSSQWPYEHFRLFNTLHRMIAMNNLPKNKVSLTIFTT